VWATIRLLESAPRDLSKGGRVRFHQGTCERGARLRILGPNARGVLAAEIRLDSETVLLPGDRFILRRPAPVDTVGGGVVVDVRPPRGRRPTPGAVDLAGASTLGDAIVVRVARAGASGRWPHDLAAELGLSPDELSRELERLASQGRIVSAAGLVVGCEAWEALSGDVETVLAAYHRDNPLRPGMSREELRARVCRAMPPEAWRLWLERAGAAERLRLEGDRVALAGHRVVLSVGDQELVKRIGARILAGGLDPPPLAEVLGPDSGERAERIVELMIAAGDLVRLSDGRTFHGQALRELRSKLREYAKTSSRIDVGTFKELARVTRKNAIPLLEHLDAERVTRRVGNVREILNV
jgi:selenocysteine-specific elongation factor